MKKYFTLVIQFIFFSFFTNSQAQFTHTFTPIAHFTPGGHSSAATLGSGDTLFLANSSNGIYALKYDGRSFSSLAHVPSGSGSGGANDIATDGNGNVFTANSESGMKAYVFEQDTLIYQGCIDDGNEYAFAEGITINNNGTIFLANGTDGLRSYVFDGGSVSNTGHVTVSGTAHNVSVSPENKVFLAHGRAFGYNGPSCTIFNYSNNSFSPVTHINGGFVYDVAIGAYESIFLSYKGFGGTTYAYPDSGLHAFHFNGSTLSYISQINNDPGLAHGLAVAPDGTIFLANGRDGLRAYEFDGASFINTAHINDGGDANDVIVSPAGTIFLSNGNAGLFAYEYSAITAIDNKYPQQPTKHKLFQNYPNPFNHNTIIEYQISKTSIVDLSIFNMTGEKVVTLVSEKQPAGNYKVAWDAQSYSSGTFIYKLKTAFFEQSRKMILLR